MKTPHTLLACLCLLGATQLALSQVKAPVAAAIPGYLNPATGKFTTQIAPAATAQPDAQGQVAGSATSLFFREDFQIQIFNYDQPSNATVICSVEMSTYEGSSLTSYNETASVPATMTNGSWSCDVPVLTLWTLQNPGSDTISASVSVMVYTQTTPVPIYRSSVQNLSLAVPGNSQTVVNSVSFKL